jgi:hypothetical protein
LLTFGQKFLTHQFTFLDPPIFLARKLILPTTSFKPAFWTHQCFRPSLEPPIRGKAKKLAVKFCEGPIAVFRICKRCGERESRRGEQQEQCQPREHLFIGGKGSTRLCCAYFPVTRWPSGDCFARRSLFLRRKQASARGRADTPPRDDHTQTNVTTYEAKCGAAPARCLFTVQRMSPVHKREKTLREFSADVCTLQDTCA